MGVFQDLFGGKKVVFLGVVLDLFGGKFLINLGVVGRFLGGYQKVSDGVILIGVSFLIFGGKMWVFWGYF